MGGGAFRTEELSREMLRISVQLEHSGVSMEVKGPVNTLLVLNWSSCKRICSSLVQKKAEEDRREEDHG